MNAMTALLGAGASVGAGVATSTEMTREITQAIDERAGRGSPISVALHYSIATMAAHDTADGGGAFDWIDVERVFAAVQMLKERDTLEVAPFIASWSPALEGLRDQRQPFPSFGTQLVEALGDNVSTFRMQEKIDRAFRGAVESIAGGTDWPSIFDELEERMIRALRKLVRANPEKVDYLAPLCLLGRPANIVTLNYDRSVELMASRANVTLDTGITSWSGEAVWKWDNDADVRLLKLHGSIDWEIVQRRGVKRLPYEEITSTEEVSDSSNQPAVVFGQRGKLRHQGPFIPMLLEFQRMLAESDSLLVVGYSFRDAHINSAIRTWVNEAKDPRIAVIDPTPPFLPSRPNRNPFFYELHHALKGEERLRVIEETAEDGLRAMLGQGPAVEDFWDST